MVSNRLQFRHHPEVFSSRDEALSYLSGLVDNSLGNAPIGESKMGEPLVVLYRNGDDDNVAHLILAIGKVDGGTGVEYQYIDSDNMETAIQTANDIIAKHDAAINSLSASMEEISGNMISNVSVNGKDAEITNGKASVTINGNDILIDGYQKADDAKDAVHPQDSVNQALGKLEAKYDNNDERLRELEKVHPDDITIGSTEKNGNIFWGTLLRIEKIADPIGSNIESVYELVDSLGNRLGEQIVVKKDSHLLSAELVKNESTGIASVIRLTYLDENHSERIIDIDVKDFLQEAEFKEGLKVVNGEVSVKKDDNSESFLSVSSDGVKVSGIQDAIDSAIETERNRAVAEEEGIKQNLSAANTRLTEKIDKVSADTHTEIDRINGEIQTDANNLAIEIQRAQGEEARIETLIDTKINTEVLERNDAIAVSLQDSKEYTDNLVGNLNNVITANKVSVSSPLSMQESDTGTTVGLNIVSNSKVLNVENDGLKATIGISYDEDNNRIILTGIDGQELSSIDARRFIKDGMLDNVAVVTENDVKYIVFTFNTESGKDVIKFAVEEIFQPYKNSDAINISTDNAIELKIDNTGDGKYLKLSADGLGLQDITPTIDNAVSTINNSLALIEQRVKSNEDELAVLDDTIMGNIKSSMIAKVVTTITPAEAENQTLIRRIDDQYYVDSTTSAMYHKGTPLETVIEEIKAQNASVIGEIDALKDQNVAITSEINDLKTLVNDLKNKIDGLMNIKSISGTSAEIKVTNTDGNIVIGFDDNAVFGQI